MPFTVDDFIFFARFFNFATILLAAIVIAWTRHDDPEAHPETLVPSRRAGGYFTHEYMAEVEMYDVDPLTEDEKKVLRDVFIANENFSFRVMTRHGMTRADWNKLRDKLVKLELAEWREGGTVQFRAGIYTELGITPER